jgi:hypothetical protein
LADTIARLSRVFSVKLCNLARRFPVCRPLFQVGSFITRHFTLADANLGFEFPIFPIKTEDYQGAPSDIGFFVKFVDFVPMQEQPANALCCRNFVAGLLIRLDIGVVEERLAVIDAGKGIADVGLSGADRFYFAPLQFDPSFVALQDVEIAQRFPIKNRLDAHE